MIFNRLKFRNKLLVSFLLIFLPLIFAISAIAFFQVKKILEASIEKELNDATQSLFHLIETTASISIRNRLAAIAEKNLNLTEYYYSKHRSGLLTRTEAVKILEEIFLNQPIGISGYIYVLNSKGDVIIHPNDRVKGTNVSHFGFVRQQLRIKDGYLEYEWRNPGEKTQRPKALSMVYYKPLDWIITISAYRNEFHYLVNIDDFTAHVKSFKSGKSGYAFILEQTGKAIIHPTFQGMNLLSEAEQPVDFLKKMQAREQGKLRYRWKNPGDPAPREKIVIYKHLPRYNWVIGSTSYVDEVYGPLRTFYKFLGAVVVLVLVLGISLIYMVSRSVTRPLDTLMEKLNAGARGDFSVRMTPGTSNDELAKLANHFNSFMNRLETYHQQLKNEIRRNKEHQAALVENDLKLTGIFNQSFQYTGILSPSGILEEINQSALDFWQVSETDIRYKPVWKSQGWFHDAETREKLKQAVKNAGQGQLVRIETAHMSEKGEMRTVDISIKPVLNTAGNIEFLIMEGRDITELKQAELEARHLAVQLEKAQKMEAIGTLAGGIAHDFNNILSGIFGYTQLAQMSLDTPEKAKNHMDQIFKGAQRAAGLIQQILTFSRQTEYQKKPLRIHLVIKEALKLLRSSIPTTIDIRPVIKSDAMVLADPTQMHQVIMNLCTNAYHSMLEKGGTLTVTLEASETITEANKHPEPAGPPKNYLKLTVSDTGHGMEKEVLEKAFDPYFTTKEIGRGTGFGLALVRAIVEEHGGQVNARSEKNKGSDFFVYLPLVEAEDARKPEPAAPPPKGGKERIMVVDDEEGIRLMISELLKSYGYTVECHENGRQALTVFEKDPEHFDLIITDMTMPKMPGDELAVRLLEIRENMPIILCTGYSERISESQAKKLGVTRYMQKPFENQALLAMIREIFDLKQTKTP